MPNKINKDHKVPVASLKNALDIIEGVQDDLRIKKDRGVQSIPGEAVRPLVMAASSVRRSLRALGMDIPVRKGPKPGSLATT